VLASSDLSQKISIQEHPSSIHCTPIAALEKGRLTATQGLQIGFFAFLDLQALTSSFPELHPTYLDTLSYITSLPKITVIDTIAVSDVWLAKLEEDCIHILEQEGCSLDVSEVIGNRLPLSIRERVASTVEENLIAAFSSKTGGERILRAGSFLLTETRRHNALDELAGYANADVDTQWNDLLSSPSPQKEIKISLARIETLIPQGHLILHTLLLEPGVKRSLDESFHPRSPK
jgi:hypothetical protein